MRKTLVLTVCLAAMLAGCPKKPAPVTGKTPPVMPPAGPVAAPKPAAVEPVPHPLPPVTTPAYRPTPQPITTPLRPVTPPVPPPPPAGARMYTVKKGDGLMSIARRELGDAKRWREIKTLNNISNPDKISVGQQIKLPAN